MIRRSGDRKIGSFDHRIIVPFLSLMIPTSLPYPVYRVPFSLFLPVRAEVA